MQVPFSRQGFYETYEEKLESKAICDFYERPLKLGRHNIIFNDSICYIMHIGDYDNIYTAFLDTLATLDKHFKTASHHKFIFWGGIYKRTYPTQI